MSRIIYNNLKADIAILEIPNALSNLPHLSPATSKPKIGQMVIFAGFPDGWYESSPVFQTGIISADSGDRVWLDASANPGNSGCPVLVVDKELRLAEVIGLVLGRAGKVDEMLRDFSLSVKRLKNEADSYKGNMFIGDQDIFKTIFTMVAGGFVDISMLTERHFRTGLVKACGFESFRKSVGL